MGDQLLIKMGQGRETREGAWERVKGGATGKEGPQGCTPPRPCVGVRRQGSCDQPDLTWVPSWGETVMDEVRHASGACWGAFLV